VEELTLYYITHEGGMYHPWPDYYKPSVDRVDQFALGQDSISYQMVNGIEDIHAFIWQDHMGEIIHRWDSHNGWTQGGPE